MDAYFTKERMKTLDDIGTKVQPEEELNEGKFIRRGTALLFAKNARAHGNHRTVLQGSKTGYPIQIQLCLQKINRSYC